MAEPYRTPATLGPSGASGAGVGNAGPAVQEQAADSKHDGAPGGLTFSDAELPVVAVPGGTPATLGGYSADPGQTPLISTADDPMGTGNHCPSGIRK